MWGNSPYIPATRMNNPRKMYVSRSHRAIYYNHGSKDDFQVRIVTEDGRAYGMLDKDYFSILKERYEQDADTIRLAVQTFARRIDIDTGHYYPSIISENTNNSAYQVKSNHSFNTMQDTFGYNTALLRERLMNFREWFTSRVIHDEDSALEEALVVIYLGMIAEWYYVSPRQTKSIWQHRMKLLGIEQVLSGELSPDAASNWSKGKGANIIGPAMHHHNIFYEPYRLQ